MPEIAEVARICSLLKTHVVNKNILKVHASDDPIVYGAVGTSAEAFQSAMSGKKIVDVKQQGKYFWLEMSSPPHALLHFGMNGWIRMNNVYTPYWDKDAKGKQNGEDWPPKYEKFRIEFEGGTEAAFVDSRRLARIRLLDVPAENMRKVTPLKENGPDPHIDKDVLTKEWLRKKLRSKRVPVKALLLDQANISGIGNWVGDEVLFKSRLHPEQYSNTFSDEEIDRLHDAIMYVIDTAIETTAVKKKFPKDWIFAYRKAEKLPTGQEVKLLKVGGRTSAIVPSLQKKTGTVAIGTETTTIAVKEPKATKKLSSKSKKRKATPDLDDTLVKEESGGQRKSTRTRRNKD